MSSDSDNLDPIKKILESTGWSCEDLLKKLQSYKSITKDDTCKSDTENLGNNILNKDKEDLCKKSSNSSGPVNQAPAQNSTTFNDIELGKTNSLASSIDKPETSRVQFKPSSSFVSDERETSDNLRNREHGQSSKLVENTTGNIGNREVPSDIIQYSGAQSDNSAEIRKNEYLSRRPVSVDCETTHSVSNSHLVTSSNANSHIGANTSSKNNETSIACNIGSIDSETIDCIDAKSIGRIDATPSHSIETNPTDSINADNIEGGKSDTEATKKNNVNEEESGIQNIKVACTEDKMTNIAVLKNAEHHQTDQISVSGTGVAQYQSDQISVSGTGTIQHPSALDLNDKEANLGDATTNQYAPRRTTNVASDAIQNVIGREKVNMTESKDESIAIELIPKKCNDVEEAKSFMTFATDTVGNEKLLSINLPSKNNYHCNESMLKTKPDLARGINFEKSSEEESDANFKPTTNGVERVTSNESGQCENTEAKADNCNLDDNEIKNLLKLSLAQESQNISNSLGPVAVKPQKNFIDGKIQNADVDEQLTESAERNALEEDSRNDCRLVATKCQKDMENQIQDEGSSDHLAASVEESIEEKDTSSSFRLVASKPNDMDIEEKNQDANIAEQLKKSVNKRGLEETSDCGPIATKRKKDIEVIQDSNVSEQFTESIQKSSLKEKDTSNIFGPVQSKRLMDIEKKIQNMDVGEQGEKIYFESKDSSFGPIVAIKQLDIDGKIEDDVSQKLKESEINKEGRGTSNILGQVLSINDKDREDTREEIQDADTNNSLTESVEKSQQNLETGDTNKTLEQVALVSNDEATANIEKKPEVEYLKDLTKNDAKSLVDQQDSVKLDKVSETAGYKGRSNENNSDYKTRSNENDSNKVSNDHKERSSEEKMLIEKTNSTTILCDNEIAKTKDDNLRVQSLQNRNKIGTENLLQNLPDTKLDETKESKAKNLPRPHDIFMQLNNVSKALGNTDKVLGRQNLTTDLSTTKTEVANKVFLDETTLVQKLIVNDETKDVPNENSKQSTTNSLETNEALRMNKGDVIRGPDEDACISTDRKPALKEESLKRNQVSSIEGPKIESGNKRSSDSIEHSEKNSKIPKVEKPKIYVRKDILNVSGPDDKLTAVQLSVKKGKIQMRNPFPASKANPIEVVEANDNANDFDTAIIFDGASKSDIRQSLLMQLSSLRNRKKTVNLVEPSKKVATFGEITRNYRKQLAPGEDTKQPAHTDAELLSDCGKLEENKSESLISMSGETDFVIVDVAGGVEIDDAEVPEDNTIHLTKTNDITKIKGWKNKKFKHVEDQFSHDPVETLRQILSEKNKSTPKIDEPVNQPYFVEIYHNDSTNTSEASTSKDDEIHQTAPKNDKSPFVSNSLDEYLTENAKLNISYAIPKSRAEEGLKEGYKDVIPINVPPTRTSESTRNEKEKYEKKPKTLAEKRRLLQGFLVKKDTYKKTEKENTLPSTQKDGKGRRRPEDYRGFILYNSKKIYLASKALKCFGKIKDKVYKQVKSPLKIDASPSNGPLLKKYTLLEALKNTNRVKYKPGPLSTKNISQDEDSKKWDISLRKLPKVYLEIVPEVGKPVHPSITHLLPCSTLLEDERIEFALSAVCSKKGPSNERTICKLPIPYQYGKEYILTRKKRSALPIVIPQVDPEKNTVESVINDLISYVETKEIEDSLVKYDIAAEHDAVSDLPGSTELDQKGETNTRSKNPKKKRKVDLELSRLSCKIINVEPEAVENLNCTKTFCKLGCVCNSLTCASVPGLHCRQAKCMFECSCPKRKVNYDRGLPLGKEVLSSDTVIQIEDRAKRNLAKVEKEFTQTVIHANDKTIVVGLGGMHKAKRITKAPRKYSDYVENMSLDQIDDEENDVEMLPVVDKDKKLMFPCFVKVQKLDLVDVAPFCLYHGRHDCPCGGKRTLEGTEINDVVQEGKSIVNDPLPSKESTNENARESTSARTRGVFYQYVKRNRDTKYKDHLAHKSKDINMYIPQDMPEYTNYRELEHPYVDVEMPLTLPGAERLKLFVFRQCLGPKINLPAIQRRKKSSKMSSIRVNHSVFEGEIIVPTNENLDIIKKLGMRNFSDYMRLLPWHELLKNFNAKKIGIWMSTLENSRLLMNSIDKTPPDNYVDIRKIGKPNGIVKWILTGILPKDTPKNLVHIILTPCNNHYEISGICLKNIQKNADVEIIPAGQSAEEKTSAQKEAYLHKNLENKTHSLIMVKHYDFKEQVLEPATDESVPSSENFPIKLELPPIDNDSRWRMIYLNSDFSYLAFIKSTYSIKYTDLSHIIKEASHHNVTIALKSSELSSGFSKSNYGIYASPAYADRLFIGPYTNQEDHNLEFLRYFKGNLVTTTYFDQLHGNAIRSKRGALWLKSCTMPRGPFASTSYIRTYPKQNSSRFPVPISPKPDKTVELLSTLTKTSTIRISPTQSSTQITQRPTKLGEKVQTPATSVLKTNMAVSQKDNIELVKICNSLLRSNANNPSMILNKVPFVILDAKKCYSRFNRYAVTDIPGFGFFAAYLHPHSDVIDLSWPCKNKVLRFSNSENLVNFLAGRLVHILITIPQDLKIKVELVDVLTTNAQVVKSEYLNGTHICTKLGVFETRGITVEILEKLGITKEYLVDRLAMRARFLAASEIGYLKKLEEMLMDEKRSLVSKKKNNLAKFMNLIAQLPAERRQAEYSSFRQKFNSAPNETIKETIEILDSDEEETDTSDKTAPNKTANPSSSQIPTNILIKQKAEEVAKPASGASVNKSTAPVKESLNTDAATVAFALKQSSGGQATAEAAKPISTTAEISAKDRVSTAEMFGRTIPIALKKPSGQMILSGYKIIKTSHGQLVLIRDQKNINKMSQLSKLDITLSDQISMEKTKVETGITAKTSEESVDKNAGISKDDLNADVLSPKETILQDIIKNPRFFFVDCEDDMKTINESLGDESV